MKLSIPQPCHENWNEMRPEEKGRFCQSCQKCVTDFTLLSDDEILKIIQKPNQCGRFSKMQLEQLNRKLKEQNQIRFPRIFRYSALIAGLGLSGTLIAQEKTETEVVEPALKNSNQIKVDSMIIRATVIGSDRFPVEDALVSLQNSNVEAITDENGYFEMKIPNENPKNIITITDLLGYSQEFCVEGINNKDIIFGEILDLEILSGVVGGIVIRRTFTGKILHAIAWPFRQIGKLF